MIKPHAILTDDGDVVLAPTKGAALAWAKNEYGDETELSFEGWFLDVGYDADNYSNKEEFDAKSGYSSWWERRVGAPKDFRVASGYLPGWLVSC